MFFFKFGFVALNWFISKIDLQMIGEKSVFMVVESPQLDSFHWVSNV